MTNINRSEEDFLQSYDYTKYDRPSIAADIVIFAVMTDKDEQDKERDTNNIRKLPPQKFKVLLIKRGEHPYKGCYALPGGFVRKNEDVYDAATRELYEETNIRQSYLKLMDVYSKENRDPRGWIMSDTFMALIDGRKCELRADSDAWEAKWFDLTMTEKELKNECSQNEIHILKEYRMNFSSEDGAEVLEPVVQMETVYKEYHRKTVVKSYRDGTIAFDHGIIILQTWLELRRMVERDARVIFDLMPESFTFAELQNAFEVVLGEKLTTPNFRRKIKDYCIETDKLLEGTGHRPAKLIIRNLDKFR